MRTLFSAISHLSRDFCIWFHIELSFPVQKSTANLIVWILADAGWRQWSSCFSFDLHFWWRDSKMARASQKTWTLVHCSKCVEHVIAAMLFASMLKSFLCSSQLEGRHEFFQAIFVLLFFLYLFILLTFFFFFFSLHIFCLLICNVCCTGIVLVVLYLVVIAHLWTWLGCCFIVIIVTPTSSRSLQIKAFHICSCLHFRLGII